MYEIVTHIMGTGRGESKQKCYQIDVPSENFKHLHMTLLYVFINVNKT